MRPGPQWEEHVFPSLQTPPQQRPLTEMGSPGSSFLDHPPSGDLEVTVDFLTEVDKLVQLIECPIFTCKSPAPGAQQGWGQLSHSAPAGEGGREGTHPRVFPRMSGMKTGDDRAGESSPVGLRHGVRTCASQWSACSQTHLKVNNILGAGARAVLPGAVEGAIPGLFAATSEHTALCPGATPSSLCKAVFGWSGWAGAP